MPHVDSERALTADERLAEITNRNQRLRGTAFDTHGSNDGCPACDLVRGVDDVGWLLERLGAARDDSSEVALAERNEELRNELEAANERAKTAEDEAAERLGVNLGLVGSCTRAVKRARQAEAERDEARARLAEIGEAETQRRILAADGTSHPVTEWDLENRALWVPSVRLEEREVHPTPWRDVTDAAQGGQSGVAPKPARDGEAPQCSSHAHPDFIKDARIQCELPEDHIWHRNGERTWTP